MSSSEWKSQKLSAIAKIIDCPHFTPKWVDSGYFVIRNWNVRDGRLDRERASYTDKATFDKRNRRGRPEFQDLVFTREAPMGECCMVPKDLECCLGQRVVLIKPYKDKVVPTYLLFAMQSPYVMNQILSHEGTGSTVSNIRIPFIENFDIPIPPLPTQRRIADILSALDEKIELNRQINATLEAIAQAIFKEWFVNFNFPGATGEMIESELGMIPKGWRVATFEEEMEAERGLSYKGDGLETGNATPMHNLNSIYEGGGYKFEGIKYYSGEYREKHLVKPGDLIIANTEQGHNYLLIGYPAIVPDLFGEVGIYSHHIYRLRPLAHSYLTPDFFYYLLLQSPIHEQVVGFANGTTVNMLKIDGLKRPKFSVPPKELILRFTELASNLRARQEENIKETYSLAALRDNLLPKLMSGEIPV